METSIKHVDREVAILAGDAHGWLDAKHVALEPALTQQETHFLGPVMNPRCRGTVGRQRLCVHHQFEAQHESLAPSIAHDVVTRLQALEPFEQMPTDVSAS